MGVVGRKGKTICSVVSAGRMGYNFMGGVSSGLVLVNMLKVTADRSGCAMLVGLLKSETNVQVLQAEVYSSIR